MPGTLHPTNAKLLQHYSICGRRASRSVCSQLHDSLKHAGLLTAQPVRQVEQLQTGVSFLHLKLSAAGVAVRTKAAGYESVLSSGSCSR